MDCGLVLLVSDGGSCWSLVSFVLNNGTVWLDSMELEDTDDNLVGVSNDNGGAGAANGDDSGVDNGVDNGDNGGDNGDDSGGDNGGDNGTLSRLLFDTCF